ncbi:DNA/RNA non-specific endonuclease [Flavobacteriaceae bacterium]|nr:DNA/RNA non-specific endonuclease [Flavobacteriaceae bacterium]
MKQNLIILFVLFVLNNRTIAQTYNNPECSYNLEIVDHTGFDLGYDKTIKQSRWVSYCVKPEHQQGPKYKRPSGFRKDPDINGFSITTKAYTHTGYDRGHLAPANLFSHNYTELKETFYLSNISPQVPNLNRGKWKQLETKIAEAVKKVDSIHINTGPIFSVPSSTLGASQIIIPSAFYKTILIYNKGKKYTMAFLLPNERIEAELSHYEVTIDEIEEITKINFYPLLDESYEVVNQKQVYSYLGL